MTVEELREHFEEKIDNIKVEILSKVKDDFVAKTDCEKEMSEDETQISKLKENIVDLKVEMSKSNVKLSLLVGILSVIGASVVTICVTLLFGV